MVEVKKQRRVVPGGWSELTAQCKSTSYRVCSGLQPQQEYCFRVRAYNAAGVSEPGPESAVVRMEQKGEAIWINNTIQLERNTMTFILTVVSLCM